jgi:hypothetical protein
VNRRRLLQALAATPIAIAAAPLVSLAPTPSPLYLPKYVYGRILIEEALWSGPGAALARALQCEINELARDIEGVHGEPVAAADVVNALAGARR